MSWGAMGKVRIYPSEKNPVWKHPWPGSKYTSKDPIRNEKYRRPQSKWLKIREQENANGSRSEHDSFTHFANEPILLCIMLLVFFIQKSRAKEVQDCRPDSPTKEN